MYLCFICFYKQEMRAAIFILLESRGKSIFPGQSPLKKVPKWERTEKQYIKSQERAGKEICEQITQ